jgi:hypothetical protein
MIILGIVLLLIAYFIAPVVPLPDPIWPLVHAVGVIALIVGVILLLLSFFGVPLGRGLVTRGNRRYWL